MHKNKLSAGVIGNTFGFDPKEVVKTQSRFEPQVDNKTFDMKTKVELIYLLSVFIKIDTWQDFVRLYDDIENLEKYVLEINDNLLLNKNVLIDGFKAL